MNPTNPDEEPRYPSSFRIRGEDWDEEVAQYTEALRRWKQRMARRSRRSRREDDHDDDEPNFHDD